MLEKVVTISERVLAEDYPSRLVPQESLALYREMAGRQEEAIAMMQHVVRIREKSLRCNRPAKLRSEAHLSRMLDQ